MVSKWHFKGKKNISEETGMKQKPAGESPCSVREVILKLQSVLESPGGLVQLQIAEPHVLI